MSLSGLFYIKNFYHDIGRRELYLQYLHKLCQLHLEAENYTEAAFTLIIYAKHLQVRPGCEQICPTDGGILSIDYF